MTVDYEESDRGTDDEAQRSLAAWDASIATFPDGSLLVGFGVEDIRDDSLPERISGPIGNIGVAYAPHPRCSLQATLGHRFERTVFSADARVKAGPRTQVRLRFEESLQTSQRLIRTGLGFLGADPEGRLIDERSERPFVVGDRAFGLVEGTFFQERISVDLRRSSVRDDFDLEVFGERRDFELQGLEDEVFGVDVTWVHRLNRRTTLDFLARYRHIDFDDRPIGSEDLTVGGIGLTRHLSSTVTASARYYLSDRHAAVRSRDLRENSFMLSIRKSFQPGSRTPRSASSRQTPRRAR